VRAAAFAALAAALVVLASCGEDGGSPSRAEAAPASSAQDFSALSRTRIFFGHQSVGKNIIDGIAELAAARGLQPPSIVEAREAPKGAGGFFLHAQIGENGRPSGKIRDFEAILRGGVGAAVDAALMKFCWVDIGEGTDVRALFEEYRSAMAALEREYPKVVFIYATVPLATAPAGRKARLKALLGRDDNLAREKMNGLLRAEYGGTGRLFDLASIESSKPGGAREAHRSLGGSYYALSAAYAADEGHLNAAGRAAAAEGLVGTLARSLRE
jgi:hypothetical protein